MMEECRMSLMVSFVLKLKSDERIDGDELWVGLSFILIMKVFREMELRIE